MRTVKSTTSGLSQVFSIPCASLTSVADGTTTYTSSVPHRLQTGARVRVLPPFSPGDPKLIYGGDFDATIVSPTVFTYKVKMPATYLAPPSAAGVVARQLLPATEYEPFALVRNNRLQIEERTPEASLYIADTATHSGNWVEVLALEDSVFSTLNSTTLAGFAVGMPLPKGARIRGAFTDIKLTSGKILAHE